MTFHKFDCNQNQHFEIFILFASYAI